MANWAGAAISLGLVIGVGIWGYQLLVRDVSGVPVVKAIEGPMRVAPTDPGGSPAEYQGLAVNNVAAEGTAEAPADRLVLAPRPIDLSDEDTVSAVLAALTGTGTGTSGPATVAAVQPAAMPVEAPAPLSMAELAAQLTDGVTPLIAVEPDATPASPVASAVVAALSEAMAAPMIEGGIALSLRPKPRPADLLTTASVDPAVEAAVAAITASAEVDAESIPVGTRLAQLGAYESAEVARSEWDRLQGRFTEYLEGKNPVIQKASSGGRIFYRLRAMGFADIHDARRFCSALVAEKADCIPLVTR